MHHALVKNFLLNLLNDRILQHILLIIPSNIMQLHNLILILLQLLNLLLNIFLQLIKHFIILLSFKLM